MKKKLGQRVGSYRGGKPGRGSYQAGKIERRGEVPTKINASLRSPPQC